MLYKTIGNMCKLELRYTYATETKNEIFQVKNNGWSYIKNNIIYIRHGYYPGKIFSSKILSSLITCPAAKIRFVTPINSPDRYVCSYGLLIKVNAAFEPIPIIYGVKHQFSKTLYITSNELTNSERRIASNVYKYAKSRNIPVVFCTNMLSKVQTTSRYPKENFVTLSDKKNHLSAFMQTVGKIKV